MNIHFNDMFFELNLSCRILVFNGSWWSKHMWVKENKLKQMLLKVPWKSIYIIILKTLNSPKPLHIFLDTPLHISIIWRNMNILQNKENRASCAKDKFTTGKLNLARSSADLGKGVAGEGFSSYGKFKLILFT